MFNVKHMQRLALILLLLLFFVNLWASPQQQIDDTTNAISLPADSTSTENDSCIIDKIPPISILIDSARAHYPKISKQEKQIMIKVLNEKTVNQEWLKYISVFATTNYGIYDNFISVQDQTMTGSSINTGTSFRWSVGLAISGAPIYDAFYKPTSKKIKELEKLQEEDNLADVELELRKTVIEHYNNTLLSYNILVLSNKNVYSNYTAMVMAEEQFTNAEITITSLANIREMYYKSLMALEKSKTEFEINYLILQEICGFKF